MRYVMPCRETDWAGGVLHLFLFLAPRCSCVCECVLVLVLVLVFPVYGAVE